MIGMIYETYMLVRKFLGYHEQKAKLGVKAKIGRYEGHAVIEEIELLSICTSTSIPTHAHTYPYI